MQIRAFYIQWREHTELLRHGLLQWIAARPGPAPQLVQRLARLHLVLVALLANGLLDLYWRGDRVKQKETTAELTQDSRYTIHTSCKASRKNCSTSVRWSRMVAASDFICRSSLFLIWIRRRSPEREDKQAL